MDIPIFNGGWSYTQKEMNELFNFITYSDSYSILEFGSGDSSKKLFDHFTQHVKELIYFAYESDSAWYFEYKNIQMVKYADNNIQNTYIPDIKFDLILIDGPNGDKRSQWYSKIRSCVKQGTIILVDDFNHYQCFSDELDRNFEYELLSFSDEPFVPDGEHSWKIVRVNSIK